MPKGCLFFVGSGAASESFRIHVIELLECAAHHDGKIV